MAVSLLAIAFRAAPAYGLAAFWPQAAAPSALPALHAGSLLTGLFFLVSGWFMVIAYERFGPRAFLRSRLIRLGVPLVVAGAVMVLLARWNDVAQLWCLQQVLLFSLGYALWRWIRRGRIAESSAAARPPVAVLAVAGVLAAVGAFGFFRAAFADLPLDLSFFIIGAAAAARMRHPLLPRVRPPQVPLVAHAVAA